MNKKFKRIAASVMAVMTLAVGMTGMSASAANTGDTDITNFIAPPSASGTYNPLPTSEDGIRYKSNDSSVYLNITSSKYSVSVQTWGINGNTWSTSSKANWTLNSIGNKTNGVTVRAGYRYQIYNKINEKGYSNAGLKFASTNQYNSSTITGKWSPDYSYESGVIVAG